MTTRGTYGFHMNGIDKLTYNHMDSYPEILGRHIFDFIQRNTEEDMIQAFDRIIMVNGDHPTKEQLEECKAFHSENVSTGMDWYALLRHSQGDLQPYVDGSLRYMVKSDNFLADSLFCEWGYIINLDHMTLEIYTGFQKSIQDNRYLPTDPQLLDILNKSEYKNCKLVSEISFELIRCISFDKFKRLCYEKVNLVYYPKDKSFRLVKPDGEIVIEHLEIKEKNGDIDWDDIEQTANKRYYSLRHVGYQFSF